MLILVAIIVLSGLAFTIYAWDCLRGGGLDSPSATIRNMGLLIAGLVALPLAIWRSFVAQRQMEVSSSQLETAQQSLRNEQFQKAAEMIGRDLLAVRLGAIDSLFQLARSYPEEFHIRTLSLLAAYVRHPQHETGDRSENKPREEIQVILVNIGERSGESRNIEDENNVVIDLQGSSLRNIWLRPGARLDRVRLCDADLTGAVLSGVVGLTQRHIAGAFADTGREPNLADAIDPETGKQLIWPSFGPL